MLGGVDGLMSPEWLPWCLVGLLLSGRTPLEYLQKYPDKLAHSDRPAWSVYSYVNKTC